MATTESSGEYLAKPPAMCCFAGTIHEGRPRGAMDEVIGVPTYVAKPGADKANGHVVLFFPDVWGMSNNALLLMDGFADAGYVVAGMDYFRGVGIFTSWAVSLQVAQCD
jgi:hypothetical protein